jgi:hypothetical protein
LSDGLILCRGKSKILFVIERSYLTGETLQFFASSVTRSVIHYDDIEVHPGLTENSLKATSDKFMAIVGNDRDGDSGFLMRMQGPRRHKVFVGLLLRALKESFELQLESKKVKIFFSQV